MPNEALSASAWKAVVQKCKVADNGLLKALAAYEKIGDHKLDARLCALPAVKLAAGRLKTVLLEGTKTAMAQSARPEVLESLDAAVAHLGDILKAVDVEQRAIDAEFDQAAAAAAEPGY